MLYQKPLLQSFSHNSEATCTGNGTLANSAKFWSCSSGPSISAIGVCSTGNTATAQCNVGSEAITAGSGCGVGLTANTGVGCNPSGASAGSLCNTGTDVTKQFGWCTQHGNAAQACYSTGVSPDN